MRTAIRVLCFFAALWAASAIGAYGSRSPVAWLLLAMSIGLIAWTFSGRIANRPADQQRAAMRQVKIWSIAEAAAIVGALFLLGAIHRPDLAFPIVILILGLHFVPLAIGLSEPRYFVLAGALIVIATGLLLRPHHEVVAALLTSACLIATSLALAVKGVRRTIRP